MSLHNLKKLNVKEPSIKEKCYFCNKTLRKNKHSFMCMQLIDETTIYVCDPCFEKQDLNENIIFTENMNEELKAN
jgi:hypothetical protein